MNDSLNNKELVAVGHQFAKAMSSDTPIIDMAKIVSRLAERLDCTTAALREMTKNRDALAAENVGLKKCAINHAPAVEHWNSWADAEDKIPPVPETPATDASLAEVRAQGVEAAAQSEQFSMWVQQGLRSFAIGLRQGDWDDYQTVGERKLNNPEKAVLECADVIAKDKASQSKGVQS